MAIHVTPIPRLTVLATPAFTLGIANAAGDAITAVASNSTLLAFDAEVPDAITFSQSGAAGSAVVASKRDHAHAMAANPNKLVLIGTVVADDDSDVTITGLSSTYDAYLLVISDMVPMTDATNIGLQMGDSSGVDTGASDYGYHTQSLTDASASYAAAVATGSARILLPGAGLGNQAGEGFGAAFWLTRPGDGTTKPTLYGVASALDVGGGLSGGFFVAERTAVIVLDRVLVKMDSGNIKSGRFTVWGLAHA